MNNELVDLDPILNNTPTANPYRHALSTSLERLRWDLLPQSWSSRKKLKGLKDKYKGRNAVILCNGPSLNKVDFSLLDNVFTIGLNKINLLFDRTNFRPSCIAAVNALVIEQNYQFYNTTSIPLFLDSNAIQFVKNRSNVHYLHQCHQQKFARDISVSLWQGYTVTFIALQIAYHLGFEEVALVGCDHYFNATGAPNQMAISKATDDSHFDPRYFSNGMKWQLPDISGSEYGYNLALQVYRASNRRIFNSTDGGSLEIFPRMPLSEFVSRQTNL